MREYEATVSVEVIRFRAKDEAQAEEMYARWFGCGENQFCPNHPEIKIMGGSDWPCGCATGWDECDHQMLDLGEIREDA